MKMWVEENPAEDVRRYVVEVPRSDLAKVNLDPIDRAVLATPHTGIADALQDLQLLAFRLEQQAKKEEKAR